MECKPIIRKGVGETLCYLWLSLEAAERAGYGQCKSVREARQRGQAGAWIAFQTPAYAYAVWQIANVSATAALN